MIGARNNLFKSLKSLRNVPACAAHSNPASKESAALGFNFGNGIFDKLRFET